MPQVNVKGKIKHFSYSPRGRATAKKLAKKLGKKVVYKKGY